MTTQPYNGGTLVNVEPPEHPEFAMFFPPLQSRMLESLYDLASKKYKCTYYGIDKYHTFYFEDRKTGREKEADQIKELKYETLVSLYKEAIAWEPKYAHIRERVKYPYLWKRTVFTERFTDDMLLVAF